MQTATLKDRLRYSFDMSLSKGPIAIIGWLALATAIVVALVALLDWGGGYAPDDDSSIHTLVWMNLMRVMDSGTMGGDDGSWPFLGSMLVVTFFGIFVTSILIGTVTSGIEAKLDDLRKGRSRIVEDNHTVILGWSEQIFTVVSELLVANQNQRRSTVAILADRDKVEMEDELRDMIGSTGRTRVVCRRGSTVDVNDLEIVSVRTSKAVVILPPAGDDPDSSVIKTLLAITNGPNRRPEPYHVVTQIRDPKNYEVARMVGRDEAEIVLADDLVARLMAQTCRQSGLSVVYTELLDFDGDEIYFADPGPLVGKTFREALHSYETSAVIGVVPAGGVPHLNPSMDTVVKSGDKLIVVTEDDDTAVPTSASGARIDESAIVSAPPSVPRPERTLVLGWNDRAANVVAELDHYVAPGSEVVVVADYVGDERELDRCRAGLRNLSIEVRVGDTTDRRTLDEIGLERFDHVILLCYSETLDAQQADAKTLVTLLHLRDIQERSGKRTTIVSEMLDVRNRNLADVTRADDFIVSDRLISLMVSQIAENKALNAVFADLFDPEGSEIYLKPALDYVRPGAAVTFSTLVESAARRGEVAIGYRIAANANDAAKAYGVVVNPKKSETVSLGANDRVVVLSEN